MYEFTFNCIDNSILITHGYSVISDGYPLSENLNRDTFLSYVQKWLDDRELYEVEYKVFIRIH